MVNVGKETKGFNQPQKYVFINDYPWFKLKWEAAADCGFVFVYGTGFHPIVNARQTNNSILDEISICMKTQIVCAITSVALLVGCAKCANTWAAAKTTTKMSHGRTSGLHDLKDLPQPVKNTLKAKTPNAEVATLTNRTQGGRRLQNFVW